MAADCMPRSCCHPAPEGHCLWCRRGGMHILQHGTRSGGLFSTVNQPLGEPCTYLRAPYLAPSALCCLQKQSVRSTGVGDFIHVLQDLGQPDVERIQQLEAFDGEEVGARYMVHPPHHAVQRLWTLSGLMMPLLHSMRSAPFSERSRAR